jgi:hypothetical protein
MGNKLCDCNKSIDSNNDVLFGNILSQPDKPGRNQSIKEDVSTELNKDDEMKIEVIESYDIENNIYNIENLKRLMRLQRRIKDFLSINKFKKPAPLKQVKILNVPFQSLGNISNSLISHDMQSVISRHSSKISRYIYNY